MEAVKLGSRISSALFVAFILIDYIAYPEHFAKWLPLRLACAVILILVGLSSQTSWAKQNYRFVACLTPIICGLFISIFIFQTKDPNTFYYAGLNLCIVGSSTLFHHSVLVSYIMAILFMAATLPFISGFDRLDLSIYIGSYLFIISTAIISIFGAQKFFKVRQDQFYLRRQSIESEKELSKSNEELTKTLETLSQTERQLFQSEKMALLGQLSAGVIHEIGNPVNYANQALYILKKRLSKANELEASEEIIHDIQDGLDRISGIIKNLQEFSHKGTITGDTYFVRESIDSALKILAKPIHEADVSIKGDWQNDCLIVAIKNQITQVLSNLINNAIHATQGIDQPTIEINSITDKETKKVVISVADNGQGIPEKELKHLFDPFFTTKDPGEGTGLGLSICYRIIEAHGGQIEVDSIEGKGTTFKVLLPLIE